MINFTASASVCSPAVRMVFFSPDAESWIPILNLAVSRYDKLCKNIAISMPSGIFEIRGTQSTKLPPTAGYLEPIENVHVQGRVWPQATDMYQHLAHGYYQDDHGDMLPTTMNVPPAPQDILELLKCQCKAQKTIQMCSCQKHNLACTDLCLCGTDFRMIQVVLVV